MCLEMITDTVQLFFFRLKVSSQNIKLDIYINGELLSPYDDKKFIGEVQLKDRSVFFFLHYFC